MFRMSVVICALIFSAPVVWQALNGAADWEDAGLRFLIALPIAGLLLGVVRAAMKRRSPMGPGRVTTDHPALGPGEQPRR